MSLNVGQVIERAVRADHVGVSELSRKLQVSRRTIYNWFHQETLSLDIICKIGSAIKHDFSKEFPDDFARLNGESIYNDRLFMGADTKGEEAFSNSVSYWMNKYIRLLEKYNELLSRNSHSSSHEY
ncbi:helix-turn-helix domain-containing protein [Pedobacter nyackensis]|uniref:helix-turn-helix domain-containing protein n=1 Tax=Pedobacter nyackensis TaxID=475255 RepID=UPI002930F2C2|nr:helix-turn-helix domain-containing protein [Pedobacter nyackensis]